MGSRERERGRSGAVALRVLMAQQPRGSAMGAGLGRAVGSPRGLWEGEATDSRVCSPHAVSNRGIFVCKAVLTLLRAAACIRSLRSRGTLGAPQHQCCLPWGCWVGGGRPSLCPVCPLGCAVSSISAPWSCVAPGAQLGLSSATRVPQFPHVDGGRTAAEMGQHPLWWEEDAVMEMGVGSGCSQTPTQPSLQSTPGCAWGVPMIVPVL